MISKEEVKNLILDIKKATGLSQAEIAERAGYKAQSLTQQISREESLAAIHSRLIAEYREELKGMYTTTLTTKQRQQGVNGHEPKNERDVRIEELQDRIKFLEELVKQQNELIKNVIQKQ